ncbi:MAG: sigma-54-dependent Fis family transcriptional regulator [Phycisphaerales bacterium]|nr:sigma-54-dependent Fis family transcriptional regulator [Phycisphaerales bacterium]
MSTVLVVDDKEMMRDSVCSVLRRAGMTALAACSGQEALDRVALQRPDAVVSDLKMPGMTGVDLLAQVRAIDEELPVVLMTAFGSVQTAVEAMKLGAFDYLTKPFEGDELLICVKRAIQHAKLRRENAVLRAEGAQAEVEAGGGIVTNGLAFGLDRLVGASPAMRSVKAQVQAVADSHGTVLIVGESGTGKEVVARSIHELSARRTGPFLAVNCAALSETLLESELFGHEKGAFTGADKMRKGRFELAHGGTLLLDEVSEVSPAIQAKLLRVLQERAFERVGSSQPISVDVRVLATSNRDLPKAVAAGEFRQDLFFRLNVLPIHLPVLTDRVEDVPVLAECFLGQIAKREGRGGVRLEPGAVDLLCKYGWPGNVRELQNVCERAVVLSATGDRRSDVVIKREMIEPWLVWKTTPVQDGARIVANGASPMPATEVPALAEAVAAGPAGFEAAPSNGAVAQIVEPGGPITFAPGSTTLEDMERDAIVRTLERYQGHRQKSADALGIGVRTLGIKLKKWKGDGLVPSDL